MATAAFYGVAVVAGLTVTVAAFKYFCDGGGAGRRRRTVACEIIAGGLTFPLRRICLMCWARFPPYVKTAGQKSHGNCLSL